MILTDWPCLTITHTRGWELRDRPRDEFQDFAHVVAWARAKGIVPDGEAARLDHEASRRPRDADRALEEVRAVRSLMYRIFSGIAGGGDPARGDVEELNRRLAPALAHRRLREEAGAWGWAWDWDGARGGMERVTWPVLLAAAELLTSDILSRVKLCEGDGCGWLFVDASRNRSRRWCDMSDCGNLAKVRRYRERHN